jgi:hypothetical protein
MDQQGTCRFKARKMKARTRTSSQTRVEKRASRQPGYLAGQIPVCQAVEAVFGLEDLGSIIDDKEKDSSENFWALGSRRFEE